MTRKRLLDELEDSEELTYWMAAERIDPFSGERADFNAALVTAKIHNAWMEPKVSVIDCLPDYLGATSTSPADELEQLKREAQSYASK